MENKIFRKPESVHDEKLERNKNWTKLSLMQCELLCGHVPRVNVFNFEKQNEKGSNLLYIKHAEPSLNVYKSGQFVHIRWPQFDTFFIHPSIFGPLIVITFPSPPPPASSYWTKDNQIFNTTNIDYWSIILPFVYIESLPKTWPSFPHTHIHMNRTSSINHKKIFFFCTLNKNSFSLSLSLGVWLFIYFANIFYSTTIGK